MRFEKKITSTKLEGVLKGAFVVERERVWKAVVADCPSFLFGQKILGYDFVHELALLKVEDHGHDRLDPHSGPPFHPNSFFA